MDSQLDATRPAPVSSPFSDRPNGDEEQLFAQDSDSLLREILEVTDDGIFEFHVPTGKCRFSDHFYRMLGYEPGDFPANYGSWRERVHPDDGDEVEKLLQGHLADPQTLYRAEFRMRRKDGSWHWILARGMIVARAADGSPIKMLGTHVDIDQRKSVEAKYQQLFRNLTSGFALHEVVYGENGKVVDFRYLEANPAFERITGLLGSRIQGKTFREVLPDADDSMIERFGKVAVTGIPLLFENELPALGRWYENLVYPAGPNRFAVLFTDITERKHQELALRASEERYRKLFENLSSGFALHEILQDASGKVVDYRFLEVNPAYERMTGLRAKDLIGRTVKEVLPEVESVSIERFGRVAQTGKSLRQEEYAATPDRWHETWAYRPAPGQFAVLLNDISERIEQEKAIRLNENRLREVADMSLDMLSRHDLAGQCLWISPASRKILGREPEAVVGHTAFEFIVEEDRTIVDSKLAALKETGFSNLQYRLRRADGSIVWVESLWSLTRTADGAPFEIHSSTRDITEHRESERRIQELASFNQKLIDTTGGLIVVFDRFAKILLFNPAAEDLLGWKSDEVLGKRFFDVFLPEPERASMETLFPDSCDSYQARRFEKEWIARDGTPRWIAWATTPIAGEDGRCRYIVCTGLDRTSQRRAEQDLRELNATLERRVQERTLELQNAMKEMESFSYSVSHDLRAPLRAVDGFSLALLEDLGSELAPEQRGYLERIRSASSHMAELIDDLLELSRSGRVEVVKRRLDLSAIALEVVEILRSQDPSRCLSCEVDPGMEVDGDPVLVRSILENLLGNSWKYCAERDKTQIEVTLETLEGRRWVQVRDNGVGFDMAYAGKLFGTFQRLHSGTRFQGTGIGLATVKKMVERHGGSITGSGVPDKGAVFRFTLDPDPGGPQ